MQNVCNEKKFVHDVYDNIAQDFSRTRTRVWNEVKSFIDSIDINTNCLEIGCGNGKNMYRRDIVMTGIDTCEAFVKICLQKSLNASIMDCYHLQYEDNSFDNIMSIAVFHHLSTEERRIKALSEMIRVLKPNGTGFVSLWSFENQNHVKNKFIQGDNLVNWKHSITGQLFQRYYYIFDESKVNKYFDEFCDNIKLIHKINVLGNWYIKFEKLVK